MQKSILFTSILVCLSVFPSCALQVNSKNENLETFPTPHASPTRASGVRKDAEVDSVPPPSTNPFDLSRQELEDGEASILRDIRTEIATLSSASDLSDLTRQILRDGEKEFRFWITDSHSNTVGFVASLRENKTAAQHITKRNIAPATKAFQIQNSDQTWANWWSFIVSRMSAYERRHRITEFDLDTRIFVIEMNVDGNYVFAVGSSKDEFVIELCNVLDRDIGVSSFCDEPYKP